MRFPGLDVSLPCQRIKKRSHDQELAECFDASVLDLPSPPGPSSAHDCIDQRDPHNDLRQPVGDLIEAAQ
jgi:hypothetical protein